MSYVNELLSSNERIVRVARDHWIVLLLPILVDCALSVVIIGLSVLGILLSPPWTWFGLLLLVVPFAHLGLRVWVWWNKQYIITNRRIIQVSGMFNKRVSDTLLEKINDVVMEQSALGRMLKFGDIQIISGSESGIDSFHRVADPVAFKKMLFDQKEAFGSPGDVGRGVEGETVGNVPELIAELGELRQQGLITDAEFEDKKQQLLSRM